MNESKFSLADLITVLTALAFGFVCFLSANFFTLGDTFQSILTAVIIFLLLCGTAFGAKWMKRTRRNFKTNFIMEIVMLVLFTGFMIFFTIKPFSHLFAVSMHKTEIQSKLKASIAQAEKMYVAYERYAENRENLYKSKLQSVVAAKRTRPADFATFGFENNSVTDAKQIENKMFTMHADLFPSNYVKMKKVDSAWLTHAGNTVNNWNPIRLVNIVVEIEQKSNDRLQRLIELSTIREPGEIEEETEDFVFTHSFDDAKSRFVMPGKPMSMSIGLAALAYLLMMLSYAVSKRSSKSTIFVKKVGGKFDVPL